MSSKKPKEAAETASAALTDRPQLQPLIQALLAAIRAEGANVLVTGGQADEYPFCVFVGWGRGADKVKSQLAELASRHMTPVGKQL